MKNRFLQLMALFFILPLCAVFAQEDYKVKDAKLTYQNEDFYDVEIYDHEQLKFKKYPKNIILLIGDGMGVSQVFAGITANKGILHLQNMKTIGFSKTQSASNYITDSAAGGTALACGKKTYNGAIGVGPDKEPIESILEIAESNGLATGLVSTSSITHATPASFIAHQPKRSMYEEIAADFLLTDIDVFIGGGESFFNQRKDGRNLTEELEAKGYQIFNSLDAASSVNEGKLGVLTAPAHNDKFSERGDMLLQATDKAVEILQKNKNGFFLMVEGSQIDWGGHANNTSFVVGEMLDFDKVVGQVLKFAASNRETLVIVTADHETGGMALEDSDIAAGKVQASYTSTDHTGVMVPVFAFGPGAAEFMGIYENTAVFDKMLKLYRFDK
ncbi:alkaline phosphatase [Saccharicrinis carchari]|uniref:Alkaline phosphatase n=1 Tax=Saccharicrinis carchari TaxID=1168039 RepID=A0A521C1N7_SACCC|nr:alkaline phosphatase [Saccharicrinis carchari]SMO53298.1 alkaline phosphatase [Saccharicrinis carchari]